MIENHSISLVLKMEWSLDNFSLEKKERKTKNMFGNLFFLFLFLKKRRSDIASTIQREYFRS